MVPRPYTQTGDFVFDSQVVDTDWKQGHNQMYASLFFAQWSPLNLNTLPPAEKQACPA